MSAHAIHVSVVKLCYCHCDLRGTSVCRCLSLSPIALQMTKPKCNLKQTLTFTFMLLCDTELMLQCFRNMEDEAVTAVIRDHVRTKLLKK